MSRSCDLDIVNANNKQIGIVEILILEKSKVCQRDVEQTLSPLETTTIALRRLTSAKRLKGKMSQL